MSFFKHHRQGKSVTHLLFLIFLSCRTCTFLDPDGQNVCAKWTTETGDNGTNTVRKHLIIECCPNYLEKNGICQECSPGTFGKNCIEKCLSERYGPKCANTCSCSLNQHCDHIHGCICDDGYTGFNCTSMCPAGYFGNNCQQECRCANDIDCNQMFGQCICPAGWTGRYCTEKCDVGSNGFDCSQTCDCLTGITCNHITGRCFDGDSKEQTAELGKGQSLLPIYIIMAAAVTGLILFAVVIKVKEGITSSSKVSKKVTTQVSVRDISTDTDTT